jgi:two-component system CheB/CheR fusion protein
MDLKAIMEKSVTMIVFTDIADVPRSAGKKEKSGKGNMSFREQELALAFQRANEELQSTREEMQSLNEELQTVNIIQSFI